MHIIFLVHGFIYEGSSMGGAENYVANMATIMAANGHIVDIIVEGNKAKDDLWKGVRVHIIEATKGFRDNGRKMSVTRKTLKNIWRSIWYNKKVREIHKKEKVDLVQSVNTYGLALFRLKHVPYIVRMSSWPPLWGGAAKADFDYEKCISSKRFDEELQLIAIKNADRVIVPSHLVKEILHQKLGIDAELVESPVVPPDSIEPLTENYLKPDNYFITYGAMNYRKSVQLILECLQEILDRYPGIHYVFAGKDTELKTKTGYVKASDFLTRDCGSYCKRIHFLGQISDRSRLFSLIQNARLCILPTRVDNLPNAVLEAMAMKKTIISTSGPHPTSVEQLINHEENGFLGPVDDPASLMKNIDIAMNMTDQERKEMEKKARNRVENLSPQSVYNKMMSIYEDVVYGS